MKIAVNVPDGGKCEDCRGVDSDKCLCIIFNEELIFWAEIGFSKCPQCLDSQIKVSRWRAKKGGMYYYINCYGEVCQYIEDGINIDNRLFDIGNYFRTEEQAESAAEEVRAVFSKHKEVAE